MTADPERQEGLKGYAVSDSFNETAVLVFARSARDAKRMAWRLIVYDYMADEYTGVRVRRLRDAKAQAWGVTAPCVLEPDGCVRCERWYGDGPVDKTTGLCSACFDDQESWE